MHHTVSTHIPTYITNMNRISQCTTRYTHTHNNTNCAHIQQTDPESIIYMKLQAKLLAITSAKTYPSFKDTPFQFAMTKDAAKHNSQLLSKYNYNLEETLAATSIGTQLEYGSEFRPTQDLEPLLRHHPLWPKAKDILNKGCTVAIEPQDNETEREDLKLGLQRGNHKGAVNQDDDLQSLLNKDVTHAYALPISEDTATKIEGGAWAPLNIQNQWTINENGERIRKKRLTHDQSFQGLSSEKSINERVDKDTLEPLIYGFMFMRMIHMIHAMRWAHPTIHILICKFDLASAYRRMHLNAGTAIKCICSTTICALIYLRLTFGGSFSPAEWCVLIELITDLAGDIIKNPL